jgi:hypothetical protein
VKSTVTLAALSMVTSQLALPPHLPPQRYGVAGIPGSAVSFTFSPNRKLKVQSCPQSMPTGSDFTLPSPLVRTVSGHVFACAARDTSRLKVLPPASLSCPCPEATRHCAWRISTLTASVPRTPGSGKSIPKKTVGLLTGLSDLPDELSSRDVAG